LPGIIAQQHLQLLKHQQLLQHIHQLQQHLHH
jgi:hypothetical protein